MKQVSIGLDCDETTGISDPDLLGDFWAFNFLIFHIPK